MAIAMAREGGIGIIHRFLSIDEQARQFGMGVYDLHSDMRTSNLDLFKQTPLLPYSALDKIKTKYGEGIIRVGLES